MSEELKIPKLKGGDDEIKLLKVACNGCQDEHRQAVVESLRQRIEENRDFKPWGWVRENWRIRHVLNRSPKLEKLIEYSWAKSQQSLLDSGRVGEFGDGSFMQWWWTWFSEGGAEDLINFIGKLVEIIMKLLSLGPIGVVIATGILASMGMTLGAFMEMFA